MEQPRTIDRSLKDRLGILHLLDQLKSENITFAEMDAIGGQLRSAGKSAVQPLLRKLWREQNSALISKYAYLLEFIDASSWVEQVIQITLKRRDLERDAQTALLDTLQDCGVDITVPPFTLLGAGQSGKLADSFPQYMAKGDDGLLWLLEDFDVLPTEFKRRFLQELTSLADERVMELLGPLLWYEDTDVVREVVAAVGRVRMPRAAAELEHFRVDADPVLRPVIERSLRRLRFVGITSTGARISVRRLPFHSAHAGPVDGAGYRLLWIARWRDDDRLDVINLQLHDATGIIGVWGIRGEPAERYEADSQARCNEELIEPVTPGYALQLLSDAIFRGRDRGYLPPAGFYLWRAMFAPNEIAASPFEPSCASWQRPVSPRLMNQTAELFDDEFFSGWYLGNCRVYELAEAWAAGDPHRDGQNVQLLEQLLSEFCLQELHPQLDQITRRLYLNADYLDRVGIDDNLVRTILAAAESIRSFPLPLHLHPFLRRFAMESLIAAREAMENGYDLRDHPEDQDWE
jgi:hypothetical protein